MATSTIARRTGAAGASRYRRPTEEELADSLLERFDALRLLAAREGAMNDLAEGIDNEAWTLVEEAAPVKVSYVARLLKVSDPTIRRWIGQGILDSVEPALGSHGPLRVTLDSVAEIKEVADELRALGKDPRVVSAAISRLEGEALNRDARFRESLNQMKRGKRRNWPDGS